MVTFHFLRPLWLAALLPAGLLVWRLARMHDGTRDWRGIVDEHLLRHLLARGPERARGGPLAWLALWWTLCVVALAGPTWRREPSPFAADTAALAIVVNVAPSMRTGDVPPDRLARSVQKIHDLIAQRAGAKSALIAYAGHAHLVMPLTRDGEMLNTFAAALDPQIMPGEGSAAVEALRLAEQVLTASGQPGSILWITDGVAPETRAALTAYKQTASMPLRVLAPLLPGAEATALKQAVGDVLFVTPDDGDVRTLARQTRFAAASGDRSERWQDAGWWFTPLIALLALLWSRPGWIAAEIHRGAA
ncbi:MAG: VWA domain-containing protein [Lentisphaerae bacterium]|nr:VWA domain-containing protein [Lentisphaerota bacterium]